MSELIINDETVGQHFFHGGRGLDLSARPEGFAYGGTAEPFPDKLIIPRSEWQARIEEMEAQKSRLSDLCDLAKLPPKNQAQTPYCWINSPAYCAEVVRVLQNQKLVLLSPASAGAQIKNYRSEGGWGKEGLEWIVEHGLVPVDKWPANAIDRRYATPANLELAKQYRVVEWWEIEPGNIDALISCLLRRTPIACGLSWWSHEVTYVDPVWKDGDIAVRFRNSWGMGYGDRGYAILQGRRMVPDDAVAPRTTLAV